MCKCDPNIRTPFCGKSGCQYPKVETKLYGFDDENVYYMPENGAEKCVSDFPELVKKLKKVCEEFFKQKDY